MGGTTGRNPVVGYLHWQDLARLDVYCEEEERSRSWVIRKALEEFLQRAYGDNESFVPNARPGRPRKEES